MNKSAGSKSNKLVIILIGPGFGHYHPIANLAISLLKNGNDVILAGNVATDSALAGRIREDGFDFISLSVQTSRRFLKRAINRAWICSLDHLCRWAAKLPTPDELPHLLARFIFGVRSYTKPLSGVSPECIHQISQLIEGYHPALIMADAVSTGAVNYLSAMHNVPWIEYTTSPANAIEKERPVYPVGLSPRLDNGEWAVNKVLVYMDTRRKSVQRHELLKTFPAVLEENTFFKPKFRVCFSIKEIDDYSSNLQHRYH